MARVLIAHDFRLIGGGAAAALSEAGHDVRLMAPSPLSRVEMMAADWGASVAVLGTELRRSAPEGLALVSSLKRMTCGVLVFAPPHAVTLRAACLEAGADGFARDRDAPGRVVALVEHIERGEPVLSQAERGQIVYDGLA
ncbi:MAG TPA: hypothetical protein VMU14_18360, partial [Acidimicrobiales bacterium]|nr:hypothetical protein [Acidimicrobiales bacterium]